VKCQLVYCVRADELIRHAALFTEWARARARAACWEEELELLCKEMRRSLLFCQYQVSHWSKLAEACDGHGAGDIIASFGGPAPAVDCETLAQGRRAFAWRAASLEKILLTRAAKLWEPTLQAVEASKLVKGMTANHILSPAQGLDQ
jgi:hypothetical protein